MTEELDINNLEGIAPQGQYTEEEINALDGVKVKIANANVVQDEVPFAEEYGKMLPEGQTRTIQKVVVETEPFVIPGTDREITHKEDFPLKWDKVKEKWGVSLHEKSKAKRFFNKLGVQSFPEVIGKEQLIVKIVKENGKKKIGFSI